MIANIVLIVIGVLERQIGLLKKRCGIIAPLMKYRHLHKYITVIVRNAMALENLRNHYKV